jgi:multidrug resistance efflux pump
LITPETTPPSIPTNLATPRQIDPRDYQAAVNEAHAQVDQATAAIANLDAQIEAQKARIPRQKRQGKNVSRESEGPTLIFLKET